MRLTRSLTAALVLAAGLLHPIALLAGGGSFSLAPIRLEVAPVPGQPYTEALELTNESREPAHLKVYTEDWTLAPDGTVTFARGSTGTRSASSWVRVNPSEFDLPPESTVDVRFTVTVPRGAPPGGYRTAIVVEQVPKARPGERQKEVAFKARIASVLYVRVGDLVPSAQLGAVTFRREPGGARSLLVPVGNPGDVHFRVKGRIELSDPDTGRVRHRLDLPDVPVLPESSREVRVELPADLRPGAYAARTQLDVGRRELYVYENPVRVD